MSINFNELPENVQKMFMAKIADNLEKQSIRNEAIAKENRDRIEDIKADKLYKEGDML